MHHTHAGYLSISYKCRNIYKEKTLNELGFFFFFFEKREIVIRLNKQTQSCASSCSTHLFCSTHLIQQNKTLLNSKILELCLQFIIYLGLMLPDEKNKIKKTKTKTWRIKQNKNKTQNKIKIKQKQWQKNKNKSKKHIKNQVCHKALRHSGLISYVSI